MSFLDCEAVGLIPRCLRRNSKAFFINTPPQGAGSLIDSFPVPVRLNIRHLVLLAMNEDDCRNL